MKTKTVLRLYLAMNILEEPLFWGPILIVAMYQLGHMSAEQIFFSEAIATGIILALDAPGGMLADLIGRKLCVALGKFLFLLSILFFAFMESPIHGYIANILWALGITLRSGAESALIYDELQRRDALHEYQNLMRRSNSYLFFIIAFTTLATGFIAEIDLRLPLIMSIPGVLISSILILFFPTEEKRTHEHTFENYKKHMREAFMEVHTNKRLMLLLWWFAVIGVVSKINFFTYNPYLIIVDFPYSQVGMVFFGINMLAFITSKYAFRIQERLKCVGFGLGFGIQGTVMLIQSWFTYYISGWLIVTTGLRWGYMNTITEPLLNKEIASEKRATVLSFQSSLSSLLQMIGFILVAPISGNTTMLLGIMGGLALFFGFLSRKV